MLFLILSSPPSVIFPPALHSAPKAPTVDIRDTSERKQGPLNKALDEPKYFAAEFPMFFLLVLHDLATRLCQREK